MDEWFQVFLHEKHIHQFSSGLHVSDFVHDNKELLKFSNLSSNLRVQNVGFKIYFFLDSSS